MKYGRHNRHYIVILVLMLSVVRERLRPLLLLEEAALEEFTGVEVENPNCVLGTRQHHV